MMLGAMLLAGGAVMPAGQSPQSCAVIEAAFTAASNSGFRAYPADIQASSRSPELARFARPYVDRMPLRAGEFDALKARDSLYPTRRYLPVCTWMGRPAQVVEEGQTMAASFSNPVFAGNGRLALVEVSFRSAGRWGHGEICVVRRRGKIWSAKCRRSWIA